MAFDERGQPQLLGRLLEVAELRRLEDGHDQERGVRAGRSRLPELVLVQDEVLAKQRHLDRGADRSQKLEAPLEVLLVGEHGDGVGAVARLYARHGDRVQIGGQDAPGGRGLLHLGDEPDPARRRPERLLQIARRWEVAAARLEDGAGRGAAPPVKLIPLVSNDRVEDRHAPRSPGGAPRSEEHTSELQSLAYLVCRLLLEKKKKNILRLLA